MTRHWHFWVASTVVALALVLGVNGLRGASPSTEAIPVFSTQEPSTQVTPTPSTSLTPSPSSSSSPSIVAPSLSTPTPKPTNTVAPKPKSPKVEPTPTPTPTPATGPPPDSLGTPDRYRASYGARYIGWDELIDRGRPLPAPTASCTRSWRSSGKDSRLDWSTANHWCLTSLNGRAYKPQGVGGSGTTEGYQIGGRPAAERNLVLISWYSRVKETGRFTNSSGESATKLTVIDLDRSRYNTVELVRPDGSRAFQNIDSHGSGMVWVGQYLYSSSLSVLWMYNADDLMMVDGRFVLPAVARWSVSGKGGLSSISLDRSSGSPRLSAINYTTSGTTYIQTFPLTATGRLSSTGDRRSRGLSLRHVFGGSGTIHSTSTITVPGSNFQGVARTGPYAFANSSALKISGRKGKGDATVVLKEGRVIKRLRMPRENVESIYLDAQRGTFVSVTEHRTQFLFSIPLAALITAAER